MMIRIHKGRSVLVILAYNYYLFQGQPQLDNLVKSCILRMVLGKFLQGTHDSWNSNLFKWASGFIGGGGLSKKNESALMVS